MGRASALVLALSLLATGAACWYISVTAQEKDESRFRRDAVQAREVIAKRIETYVALLRGTAGLLAAGDTVSHEQFSAFVGRFRLTEFYPGTLGIGFSRRLRPGELDAFEAEQRSSWDPDFRVWPPGDREEYHSIQFLEPLNRANARAIGYDMFTEDSRRAAMERARDDAVPAASGLVRLVQNSSADPQRGFLIFLPVYRGGVVPATVRERREMLLGFAYAPLRVNDLLGNLYGEEWTRAAVEPHLEFEIYDGSEPVPIALMHKSAPGLRSRDPLRRVDTMEVAGRPWTFVFTTPPGFFDASERGLVPAVGIAGTALSLMLFGLVRAQANARRMAQESDQLHRAVVETAVDGIITLDGSDRIRTMNPAAERIFGYTAPEVRGRHIGLLIPEDDQEEPVVWSNAVERAGSRETGREVRGRRKDNTLFPLDLAVSRTLLDTGWISTGIVRDISERKAADLALRESEARFRLMADAAPVLIWLAGTDKRCYWFNKTWLEFTGRAMEQEIGEGWSEGVHPEDAERCAAVYSGAVDRQEEFQVDYRLRRADGEYRWMADHGVPIYTPDGGFAGFVGSCTDITDRKQAAAALARQAAELARSNAELANFAHVAAHDLKEPLRGIRHSTAFLLEDYGDRLDEMGKQRLGTLDALAKRMHDLLDALLMVAQVGDAPMSPGLTDMGDLFMCVKRDLAPRIADNNAEVVAVTPLPRVRCDAVLVGQVLSNLIVNAIKYNESEHKRIEVGAQADAAGPVFFVRDNGIGISPGSRESIFRMFKRLHGRDRYGGGSGAGLAIVRKIVERHGGRVWVESEPGAGSTFYFTLGPSAGFNAPPALRQEELRTI